MINKYLSPGVFIKEMDVSGVIYPRLSKRYSRRIKIGKIFGINVPNIIITSTPKLEKVRKLSLQCKLMN